MLKLINGGIYNVWVTDEEKNGEHQNAKQYWKKNTQWILGYREREKKQWTGAVDLGVEDVMGLPNTLAHPRVLQQIYRHVYIVFFFTFKIFFV